MTTGEKIFFFIVLVALILSNPPVLTYVNNYCKTHPLTLGLPTFWVYLTSVWTVVIVAFGIAAWKLEAWNKEPDLGGEK
ncbi:hypothetical protein DRN44_04515 [Thermococci archaeon]|nr:MAG: hypothetical protein DRN44_04515 [Thermococci archaeon]